MPSIKKTNWHVSYYWSSGSGLKLGACDYQGTRVIHNASVPFVYVNYAGAAFGPFTDKLKSTSASIAVREIMHGFDLKVTYDWYGPDYQYDHIWRFHSDGQFGASIVIQGPGEEINGQHTYHIPFRYDLDLSGASGDSFQKRLVSGVWEDVPLEGQHVSIGSPDYPWRLIDKASGKSASVRARGGDSAELWALQYKAIESWNAWGATAPLPPGSPGSVPDIYANGQTVQDTNVVLWYIAHIPAVDRVAACGPWFKLDGFPVPPDDPAEGNDHQAGGGHH